MVAVSVVMPVHNGGERLERAVASVLRQDGPAAELIIVDDGSSDGVVERLPRGEQIQVVRLERNLGVSAARNAGLHRARGEFVAFVDADDMALPGMLKTLHSAAVARDAEVAVCGYYLDVREDLRVMRVTDSRARDDEFICVGGLRSCHERASFAGALADLLEGDLFHPVFNKLYRRRMLDGLKFDENLFVCYEDELFNLEVFAKANRVVAIPDILYRTDFSRPGILSRRYDDNRYFNILKLWKRYESLVREFDGLRPAAHKQLLLHYLGLLAELGESAEGFEPSALFHLAEDIFEQPAFRRAAADLRVEPFYVDAVVHTVMESVLPGLRRQSPPALEEGTGGELLRLANLLSAIYSINTQKRVHHTPALGKLDDLSERWRVLLPDY